MENEEKIDKDYYKISDIKNEAFVYNPATKELFARSLKQRKIAEGNKFLVS